MATWQAEIKVVPTGSFFKVTVEAGSAGTANETIDAIYRPLQVRNLRQISSNSISSQESVSIPGGEWLVGILIFIFIVYHWWYIVIPLALIPFLWGMFFD